MHRSCRSGNAAAGGPISVVEDGDLVSMDLEEGKLEIIGIAGQGRPPEAIAEVLQERMAHLEAWRPPPRSGLLELYTRLAGPACEGARLRLS